jgi:hypothetical protein
MADDDARSGEELAGGRFVRLGPLGEGSQGKTFDGVDKREGRPVAIKRFDVRGARAWKDVELAEREARVLAALSHPRLPAYVDHFEHEGALYLVMEKIDGESLASLRKRGQVLAEADVVRLLHDASEVLDYLHGLAPPVIHRDLKPGNVIRKPDGSFAFVDFGAVRDRLRPEGGSTVVGTFGYMAPEQFQGRALPQSDVYAIGATALTLLTGEEPEALPHKGLGIDVRAALKGRASPRLVEVLEQLLEPDPDRRATRIAPLVERAAAAGPSPGAQKNRDRHHEPWEDWQYALETALERGAREFERRAEGWEDRGGPGARGFRQGAEGLRRGAEELRRAAEEMREKHARREEKHARREEKFARRAREREARWEERQRRRDERHRRRGGPPHVPWPIALIMTLGLTIGIVAVSLALQVVVPALLMLLSLLFGRGLREAASTVRASGREAVAAMRRSQQWVGGALAPPREEEREEEREAAERASEAPVEAARGEGVRVAKPPTAGDPDARARVADPADEARAEAEREMAEAEREAEEAARGKR